MMPSEPQRQGEGADAAMPAILERPRYRWHHKISAVLLAVFCLEIGLFLLIFPWTTYWDVNYVATLIPQWRGYWDNLYIRGAVSGLGMVNLYISMLEIFRLRRFAQR